MTKDADELPPMNLAEVQQARADLVKMGLLADSGRRRDGHIVWQITPLGLRAAEALRAGGEGGKTCRPKSR
jgi:hypothetical protein